MERFDKQVLSKISYINEKIAKIEFDMEGSHIRSVNDKQGRNRIIKLNKQKLLLETYIKLTLGVD